MSDDIVKRLLEFDWYGPPRKGADELLNEAAAEIIALRKLLHTATCHIDLQMLKISHKKDWAALESWAREHGHLRSKLNRRGHTL